MSSNRRIFARGETFWIMLGTHGITNIGATQMKTRNKLFFLYAVFSNFQVGFYFFAV